MSPEKLREIGSILETVAVLNPPTRREYLDALVDDDPELGRLVEDLIGDLKVTDGVSEAASDTASQAAPAEVGRGRPQTRNGKDRARQFSGRSRRVASFVAVVATAVAVVLAVLLTLTARRASVAARERDAAVNALERADVALEQANQARLVEAEVMDFMVELYRDADTDLRADAPPSPRDLLDRGVARVNAELDGRPQVQLRLMFVLGRSYWSLGHFDAARELFETTLAGLEEPGTGRNGANFDRANFDPELRVRAKMALAQVALKQNALDEAESLFLDAQGLLGASAADDRARQISVVNFLATIQGQRGDHAAAARQLREVIAQFGGGAKPTGRLVDSYINLCATLTRVGELTEALDVCRRAVEGARSTPKARPNLASAIDNYASALVRTRRLDEAKGLFKEALEIRRDELGEGHPDTAHAYSNLGVAHYELGEFQRASALFARAADGMRKALGTDHPNYGVAILNLGDAELSRGLSKASRPRIVEAERALRAGLGDDHFLLAVSRIHVARQSHADGEDRVAAELLEGAYGQLLGSLGAVHYFTRLAAAERARLAADLGEWVTASMWADRALEHSDDAESEAAAAEASYLALWVLGRSARATGRIEQAEARLCEAIELVETQWHAIHPHMAALLLTRAELALGQGDRDRALRLAQRAEAIYHQSVVQGHPGRVAALRFLETLDGATTLR